MKTDAYFENIASQIKIELNKATSSIYIAVAWFTNLDLFETLVEKAKTDCTVFLMVSNDEINQNSSIDFSSLNIGKSRVYWIGDGNKDLMHNKFCVIDNEVVINGSYNWSYKAESNLENIIITQGDHALAEQFINEFKSIIKRYFTEIEQETKYFPLDRIIKWLEILKNFVLLEDEDELLRISLKLEDFDFNSEVENIISLIKNKEYSSAIVKIQMFIQKNQQIVVWDDFEIAGLKLEIKTLENQVTAFDNERVELEKLISDFQHRHTMELGELILKILRKRKEKFKAENDEESFKEAEQDERSYREQVDTEKQREIHELTDKEKQELKKKYRKASMICHPDRVSDDMKEMAENTFIELKNAYDANDLEKVEKILKDLENKNFFRSKSETVSEKELLKTAIAKLKLKIQQLENAIREIKESEAYQTISEIEDWDLYFSETKDALEKELEVLMELED